MKTAVCLPLTDMRNRVEATFHSIGVLLDQLSAVAAAFQGHLRQDPDAGIELPKYSKPFMDGLKTFDTDFGAFHDTHVDMNRKASDIRDQLPLILDHCIHLRSCTFTLKVISARYPEISGFAEEMAECVFRIRNSVDALNIRLNKVVAAAPELVEGGEAGRDRPSLDEAFRTEPASMRIAAEEVDQMISRLMSTLQCGDIATQRLEHVVQSVEAVEEAGLSPEDRARFLAMINGQLEQTLADLASNCGMFTENFGLIAVRIEHLEENAALHHSDLVENYKDLQRRLDGYFNGIRQQLRLHEKQIEAFEADSQTGGASGSSGISTDIFAIESAVLDIYYMALNTTLSCGRLGGGATSAAPITSEIRYHVQHLGTSADAMSALAPSMAESMAACREMRVGSDLEQTFASEQSRIASQVAAITERAREVWLSPRKLNELSRELLSELPRLRDVTDGSDTVHEHLSAYDEPNPAPVADQRRVDQLSEKIFAFYTMNSEREVHKKHFFVDVDSADIAGINLFGDSTPDDNMDLASVLF